MARQWAALVQRKSFSLNLASSFSFKHTRGLRLSRICHCPHRPSRFLPLSLPRSLTPSVMLSSGPAFCPYSLLLGFQFLTWLSIYGSVNANPSLVPFSSSCWPIAEGRLGPKKRNKQHKGETEKLEQSGRVPQYERRRRSRPFQLCFKKKTKQSRENFLTLKNFPLCVKGTSDYFEPVVAQHRLFIRDRAPTLNRKKILQSLLVDETEIAQKFTPLFPPSETSLAFRESFEHELRQFDSAGQLVLCSTLQWLEQQHGGGHLPFGQHLSVSGLHGRQRGLRMPLHLRLPDPRLHHPRPVGLDHNVWPGRVHVEPAPTAGLPGPSLPPPLSAAPGGHSQWGADLPLPGRLPSARRARARLQRGHGSLWEKNHGAESRTDLRSGGQDAHRPAVLPSVWEVRETLCVCVFVGK